MKELLRSSSPLRDFKMDNCQLMAKEGQLVLVLWTDLSLSLFCFVLFGFNVPVNNFSVMSGRSHRFLGIASTFFFFFFFWGGGGG